MPVGPEEIPEWMLAKEKVLIQGRVSELRPKPDERLQIILEHVRFERESGDAGELSGKLVWTWEYPRVRLVPGQEVSVNLRIKPVRGFLNPGLWDSGFYWARQGVFFRAFARADKAEVTPGPRPENFFFDLRQTLRRTIVEYTPDNQGRALLLALLLGDRFFLEQGTLDNFQKASLAHSLALSGMHLGFVAGLGFVLAWIWGLFWPGIFLKIPRPKLAVLIGAPLVLSYVWLGGATPSLMRSCIMFGFWGVLLLLNRGRVLIDGLFLALALILFVSPLSAYDVRLQFSAVAVAGIAVWGPVLWRVFGSFLSRIFPGHEHWSRGRVFLGYGIRFFLGLFLLSVCANVALLPLMVWNFGSLSPNFWLNLFWIPVLGMVVVPLGVAGLLLAVLPWSAGLGGIFLHADAGLLQGVVNLLAFFDAHGLLPVLVTLRPKWPQTVSYYALITGVFVFRQKPLQTLVFVLFTGLFLLAYPGLEQGWRGTGHKVCLRMPDVGQGQSLVVEGPKGGRVLIDGGGSWSRRFDMGRAVTAPVLTWGRRPELSLVVMTHPDHDHYRGLIYPLTHFDVAGFAYNGRWPEGQDHEVMQEALRKRGLLPRAWYAGHVLDMGEGLSLEVLHPPEAYQPEKDNNASLVLRLVWRGKGLALLCGDLEAEGIGVLLSGGRDLSAEVLVLPHHGSRSSLSLPLYDRVNPKYALAATGYLNHFGFPHIEVLKALKSRGIPLYTTAGQGAVSVAWDGPEGLGLVQTFVRGREE